MSLAPRVLVLSAHPDDAEISLGGTIARLCSDGADVFVATFTTSEYTPENAERRRAAAERASGILGHELIWIEDGRHNQVEDIAEYRLVGLIDEVVKRTGPDVVIGPWGEDSHVDHARLARAALASSRCWDADLFAYCPAEHRTPAFQRFLPTLFIDIGPFVERKREAIQAFNFGSSGFRRLEDDQLSRLWSSLGALHGWESAEGLMALRTRRPVGGAVF